MPVPDDFRIVIEEQPDRPRSLRWRWSIIDTVKEGKDQYSLGDRRGVVDYDTHTFKWLAERKAEKTLRKRLDAEKSKPRKYEWSGSEFLDHQHPREF